MRVSVGELHYFKTFVEPLLTQRCGYRRTVCPTIGELESVRFWKAKSFQCELAIVTLPGREPGLDGGRWGSRRGSIVSHVCICR